MAPEWLLFLPGAADVTLPGVKIGGAGQRDYPLNKGSTALPARRAVTVGRDSRASAGPMAGKIRTRISSAWRHLSKAEALQEEHGCFRRLFTNNNG